MATLSNSTSSNASSTSTDFGLKGGSRGLAEKIARFPRRLSLPITLSTDQFFCSPCLVILASLMAQIKSVELALVVAEELEVSKLSSGPISASAGIFLGIKDEHGALRACVGEKRGRTRKTHAPIPPCHVTPDCLATAEAPQPRATAGPVIMYMVQAPKTDETRLMWSLTVAHLLSLEAFVDIKARGERDPVVQAGEVMMAGHFPSEQSPNRCLGIKTRNSAGDGNAGLAHHADSAAVVIVPAEVVRRGGLAGHHIQFKRLKLAPVDHGIEVP